MTGRNSSNFQLTIGNQFSMSNFLKNIRYSVVAMKRGGVQNQGFTFIELLVVVGIMIILSTTTINLLFSTLRGSTKDKVVEDVKLSGDRALAQIENSLRFASEIVDNGSGQVCQAGMTAIGYVSYGLPGNYSLSGTRIASNSNFLTSDSVQVRALDFSCKADAVGEPAYVDVTVTIGRGNAGTDKAEEVYEETFKTGVSLRKY